MSQCEEPECSFQLLEERSAIGCYAGLFNVITSMLQHYDQPRPLNIISYVGMTMRIPTVDVTECHVYDFRQVYLVNNT